MNKIRLIILATLLLAGCEARNTNASSESEAMTNHSMSALTAREEKVLDTLPVPHTNNAVALVPGDGVATIWSFNGLRNGKTYEDVSKSVFRCTLPSGGCRQMSDVPVESGRLASVAVFLHDRIFLFGGYTVDADGTEISTPEVFAFNPETEDYQRRADMPVPVDDAVAFSFGERYIALVSGWHNDGNVGVVQVFDTWEDIWLNAADFPGMPVFGHAGGAVGNKFVITDGVGVVGEKDGRRQFGAIHEAWLGKIDVDDPTNITWQALPPHPGGPLYRMAAVGDAKNNRIVFYGGGDNPYNYNGIGYDGVPAKASDLLFAFDLDTEQWMAFGPTGKPSMDHRGLMIWDGAYWTLGGMNDKGDVTGDLLRISIVE